MRTLYRQLLVMTSQHHKVQLTVKQAHWKRLMSSIYRQKSDIYKQNIQTHTQSGAENSLSQFCLTTKKLFLLSISRKRLTFQV